MNKIAIIGSSGSGKSHLAQELGNYYEFPVIDLDNIILDENYKKLPLEVYRELIQAETNKDKWIIEGVYPKVGDIVWPSADAVIWLNLPFSAVRERYDTREKHRNRSGPFPEIDVHQKEYEKLERLYPEMLEELTVKKLVRITVPNYNLEDILSLIAE